jgi:4-amino-4-deoxy-L-arabinose transferase-like glycosyltransferase
LTSVLASQIAWLLPLALICLVALLCQRWHINGSDKRKRRVTLQQGVVILWGVWFITVMAFFSVAAFIKLHYLTILAPAIAALAGIGLTTLWAAKRARRWQEWLLLLGVEWLRKERGQGLSRSRSCSSPRAIQR